MPSIGPIKIPLISELDPKGFNDAKARAQGLRQAGGMGQASPGWGNLGPPAPPGSPAAGGGSSASPVSSALARVAGSLPGGGGIADVITAAGAGPAAAALAIFSVSQIAARSAIELRRNSREAGVTTDEYGRLGQASRRAGISMEETIGGVKKARASFEAAAMGDAGESLFLKSLGLNDAQIAAGMNNVDQMTGYLRGSKLNDVQKTGLFGSIAAADAAMSKGGGSFFAPTAGEARPPRQMQFNPGDLGMKVAATFGTLWESAFNDKRDVFDTMNDNQIKAEHEENRQRIVDAANHRREEGRKMTEALLNPSEIWQNRMGKMGNVEFVGDQARMRNLYTARAAGERLSAESPFMTARQQAGAESQIVGIRAANGGYSNTEQAARAQLAVSEKLQNAVRGLGSRYENLQADLGIGQQKWELSAMNPWMSKDQLKQRKGDQTDAARAMGLQIQDYTDTMTHAGGLAGAADMNTVGGYSQLVGAQEGMRQSGDSRAMAEMILKQLPTAIANAIRESFGFQFRRPLGPMN